MAVLYERLTDGVALQTRGSESDVETVVYSSGAGLFEYDRDSGYLGSDVTIGKHGYSDWISVFNGELLANISDNRIDEILRLLDDGACVDSTCAVSHLSAVHLASLEGRTDILALLLDRGAIAYRLDKDGRSPLHLATRFGHSECASILVTRCPSLLDLKTGCDQNVTETQDVNFTECFHRNHEDVCSKLPQFDAGSSPLHVSSQWLQLPCMEVLLHAQCDVMAEDEDGLTSLDVMGERRSGEEDESSSSFLRVVQTLLFARGLPGRSRDTSRPRHTPLHSAVRLRCPAGVRRLATIYKVLSWDKMASHPIHEAVVGEMEEELKVLLSVFGPSVTTLKNGDGYSPLHLAVLGEWERGVKLLMKFGADVTTTTADYTRGHESETVLHLAARSGNVAILEELLKSPQISEIVNEPCSDGSPPLFHAVFGRSMECVDLLLSANASIKTTDHMSRTVLHWATEYNLPQVLSQFFKHDPQSANEIKDTVCTWGLLQGTVLHMASHIGSSECIKVLLSNGCNPRSSMTYFDHTGFTSLHLAANSGRHDAIKTLVEFDATLIHEKTSSGWMPIHLACQYGLKDSVTLLIKAGSDLSAECKNLDGYMTSAMDLLINQLKSPVEVLKDVFDSSIIYTPQMDSYINIDYTILLPGQHSQTETFYGSTFSHPTSQSESRSKIRRNQLRVVDALLHTGDQQNQQSLLMHPLIESFLHLQWKTLSGVYYGIICIYAIFIVAFTLLVVGMYSSLAGVDSWVSSHTVLFRVVAIIALLLLILHEIVLFFQAFLVYLLTFESWMKIICYFLSFVVAFANHNDEWSREVTAAAVLMAWIGFMFLIARVPRFGYCVLMFSKVASNLFRVIFTFSFLIIGFTIAFMIEFEMQKPFESTFEAFIKTTVMMTGEFDYSGLFQDFNNDGFPLIFAKIMLILFVLLVSIVLMNLLVAMAVTDIKDLDTQGKIDRLRKEAEFVSMFERILFDNVFLAWLPSLMKSNMKDYQQVPREVQLCVIDEKKDGARFPEELRRSILSKANSNRERSDQQKRKEKKRAEKEVRKQITDRKERELFNLVKSMISHLETKTKVDKVAFRTLESKIDDFVVMKACEFEARDENPM